MKLTALMESTALFITSTFALADAPKYAADVPENVLTPDVVETDALGRLEFFDGMPSDETVQSHTG